MKSVFKNTVAIAAFIIALAACNKMESPMREVVMEDGKHVCKMVLYGSVAGYEGTTVRDNIGTRSTSSWSDGDLVYIAFHSGNAIVPGTAIYSASDGWSVSFDGDLTEGSSQQCVVRYFVNPTFANENLITINPQTEIYEDVNGTFDYGDGIITVTASLTPKVRRIRFTGNSGDRIHVTGIKTFTTFSPAGNLFSTTGSMVPLTVDTSGSTPYVYGFFTYDDCKIGVVGSDFAYTLTCNSSIFQAGDSGYMKIPSRLSHSNWKTGLYVTVNGVDFRMLPVAGYSEGFFLMGETEVTEALFRAVQDESSDSQIPATYYNSSNWASFITVLNYKTNLVFHIPTEGEWGYAFQGGSLSQGYTYSGSNNPGDVAWYSANSGNALHPVKQLAPNELGLYDMSGNVCECTTGVQYRFRGGYYLSTEDEILVTSQLPNGNSFLLSEGKRTAPWQPAGTRDSSGQPSTSHNPASQPGIQAGRGDLTGGCRDSALHFCPFCPYFCNKEFRNRKSN